MKRVLSFACVALLPSGCATMSSLQPSAGGETFQVQGRTYDQVWNAAVETAGVSLTIDQSDKATGTIKAEREASATSWGEVVGIFIRPSKPGASAYTVEVESMERDKLQLTGENWAQTMVTGIKARLGL